MGNKSSTSLAKSGVREFVKKRKDKILLEEEEKLTNKRYFIALNVDIRELSIVIYEKESLHEYMLTKTKYYYMSSSPTRSDIGLQDSSSHSLCDKISKLKDLLKNEKEIIEECIRHLKCLKNKCVYCSQVPKAKYVSKLFD